MLRRLRIEAQLNVPMDTMIITATSAAIGMRATQSPTKHHHQQQEHAGGQSGQPPTTAGFHVDDRLTDHRAAGHAADEARRDIGHALADALAVLVAG